MRRPQTGLLAGHQPPHPQRRRLILAGHLEHARIDPQRRRRWNPASRTLGNWVKTQEELTNPRRQAKANGERVFAQEQIIAGLRGDVARLENRLADARTAIAHLRAWLEARDCTVKWLQKSLDQRKRLEAEAIKAAREEAQKVLDKEAEIEHLEAREIELSQKVDHLAAEVKRLQQESDLHRNQVRRLERENIRLGLRRPSSTRF